MKVPFDICKGEFPPFLFIRDERLSFRFTTMWPDNRNVIVGNIFVIDIDFHGGIQDIFVERDPCVDIMPSLGSTHANIIRHSFVTNKYL